MSPTHDCFSILPVLVLLFLLLRLALLQPPPLVLVGDLVSRQDVCVDESYFQIAGGKGRFSMAEPLEANDAVGSYAVNECNDTRQNLDP
jgi:hypothetical protein